MTGLPTSLDRTLISRTLNIGLGEFVTAFRLNNPHQVWRLTVAETAGTGGLLVRVLRADPANRFTNDFNVNPFGAESFTGTGACVIEIFSVFGAATASASIDSGIGFQGVYVQDDNYVRVGAWANIGGNNGFAPNFANYLMLYVSGAFDLRVVDINAVVVATYVNLNPNDFLLNTIPISKRSSYQIQATGAVGNVTYRPTWFNRR